mmetsp:Transcript_22609/g.50940  ORF Transcript_22609/g.50940 Transcript_22609/m.50940 type:complete len:86 (-) Transcript_22609:1080-1337(-)
MSWSTRRLVKVLEENMGLHTAAKNRKHLVHACGPYGNSCGGGQSVHMRALHHSAINLPLSSVKGLYGSAHKHYSAAADANGGDSW